MSVTAAEFAQTIAPSGARQSQLAPFDRDLRTLKKQGYTLAQLRTFLQQNGIEVTAAAISAYLSKPPRRYVRAANR